MDPQTVDKLQKRLESLGSKLSPEVCKELRDILQEFAHVHYEMRNTYDTIGEAFKMAVIHLIPGKTQPAIVSHDDANDRFRPTTKPDKGNPLAELLHNLSEADKAKLVGSLEQNLTTKKE